MGIMYYKDSNGTVHEIGAPPDNPTPEHGDLIGLGDDDHPQYALADGSRGTFAATGHTHTGSDDHAHAAYIGDAPADGTGYVRKDNAWAAESGGGGVTDHGALTGLSDADHVIGSVQGLQTALDGKSDSGHDHSGVYDPAGSAATAESNANGYTDTAVADKIPEGADTVQTGFGISVMTQAEYDGITPDSNTVYLITA